MRGLCCSSRLLRSRLRLGCLLFCSLTSRLSLLRLLHLFLGLSLRLLCLASLLICLGLGLGRFFLRRALLCVDLRLLFRLHCRDASCFCRLRCLACDRGNCLVVLFPAVIIVCLTEQLLCTL